MRGMERAQTWDPEAYARNARFVADLGMPVVELLAPRPGERVLDLGCGDGALTVKRSPRSIAPTISQGSAKR
jgi:trans-aconitate methyltransferase